MQAAPLRPVTSGLRRGIISGLAMMDNPAAFRRCNTIVVYTMRAK